MHFTVCTFYFNYKREYRKQEKGREEGEKGRGEGADIEAIYKVESINLAFSRI